MSSQNLAIRIDSELQSSPSKEDVSQYLPLDSAQATRFLGDWEGFVLSCLRRMRVREEEEVLYRIFHRALQALPEFRQESKLSTWLYRITWREAARSLGEHKKSAREIRLDDCPIDPVCPAENVEHLLQRRETASRVRRCLDQLSVLDREVIALHYLEELKYTEIAERLEAPLATIKVRVHRALGRLKQVLEEDHGE